MERRNTNLNLILLRAIVREEFTKSLSTLLRPLQ